MNKKNINDLKRKEMGSLLHKDVRRLIFKRYLDVLDNAMLEIAYFPKSEIKYKHKWIYIHCCIEFGYLKLLRYLRRRGFAFIDIMKTAIIYDQLKIVQCYYDGDISSFIGHYAKNLDQGKVLRWVFTKICAKKYCNNIDQYNDIYCILKYNKYHRVREWLLTENIIDLNDLKIIVRFFHCHDDFYYWINNKIKNID